MDTAVLVRKHVGKRNPSPDKKMKLVQMKLEDICGTDPDREMGNLEELETSIKSRGLLVPLVVDGTKYLVDGRRRFAALQRLGVDDAPVLIMNLDGPVDRKAAGLAANLMRKDLSAVEKVQAVKGLHDELVKRKGQMRRGKKPANSSGPEELAHSQGPTAQLLGFSEANVSRLLKLGQALEKYPTNRRLHRSRSLEEMERVLHKAENPQGTRRKRKRPDAALGTNASPTARADAFVEWYESLLERKIEKTSRVRMARHRLRYEFREVEQVQKDRRMPSQASPNPNSEVESDDAREPSSAGPSEKPKSSKKSGKVPSDPPMSTALKAWRSKKKLSLEDAAMELMLEVAMIKKIEAGKMNSNPALKAILQGRDVLPGGKRIKRKMTFSRPKTREKPKTNKKAKKKAEPWPPGLEVSEGFGDMQLPRKETTDE